MLQNMRPEELALEDEIDLRRAWEIVTGHKWGILGLSFVAALVTALVAFSLEPVYRATVSLLIEFESPNVVSIEEVYVTPGANLRYFETEHQLLESRTLAEDVVERLQLWKHPEFDPRQKQQRSSRLSLDWRSWLPWTRLDGAEQGPFTQAQLKEEATSLFRERLTVEPVRRTQLIHVSFEAHDPALSATVANTMAEAYIESGMEARLQMTQQAAGWLTERLDGLRAKLGASEKALQEFREHQGLVDVQGVKTLATNELNEIAASLAAARRQRSEAEIIFQQVRALKGTSRQRFESIPAVLGHPAVQQLMVAEASAKQKVAELAKRYGPKHPNMIAARSQLQSAREQSSEAIERVVDALSKEHEVAQLNEADLQRAMSAAKNAVQAINRKESQLGVLEREVAANRHLYDLFLTRFKETSTADDIQSTNARIVDPAVAPVLPYKPNKTLMILTAAAGGAFLGIALGFVLASLDNTLKDTEDVEKQLGLPVLGSLPKLKTLGKNDMSPLRHFIEDPQSAFSEGVRTIRTVVLLSNVDSPLRILLVTSSLPGEGKTTIATNLAFALGQMEKVLLIDADMRRPLVAEAIGLDAAVPGLSQLAARTAEVSECVHEISGTNVYVMPAGIVPPNPLELLSSKRFSQALDTLANSFDHIVIDCAPALAVSDAQVVATHASAVIYVIEADGTPYQAAREGVKRMRQSAAPIIGVVLNQVPTKRFDYLGQYGYGKHDYYTDKRYAQRATD